MKKCNICNTELDQLNKIETKNCGGDCLLCMANAGDPDCIAALIKENKQRLMEQNVYKYYVEQL